MGLTTSLHTELKKKKDKKKKKKYTFCNGRPVQKNERNECAANVT